MKIAILGYGVVGSGVEEIISNQLGDKEDIKVVKIWNRPNKDKVIPHVVTDIDEIIQDKEIDCVFEALNGIHPAYELILASLKNGKHVISANKAVVAAYFQEFELVARENGVLFKYEASVGGGMPFIKELEKTERIDKISAISGILNGTSNYILSRMSQDNLEFEVVLAEAKALGFAEENPSADIDGFDILNKLIISGFVAFNGQLKEEGVSRFSMKSITLKDIQFFKEAGFEVKYLGTVSQEGNSFEGDIILTACPQATLEANTSLNFNCASLIGETVGTLTFYGQGAGKYPTAHSMVQDLLDIKNEEQMKSRQSKEYKELDYSFTKEHRFVLRSNQTIPQAFIEKQVDSYMYLIPMTYDTFKSQVTPLLDDQDLVVKLQEA